MTETAELEYKLIGEIVTEGSSVLDLGCGSGDLMSRLIEKKNVRAQGIEIDDDAIYKCVARGLSVFHGDLDTGLSDYGDKSFDYVILNQSIQQVKKPDAVLNEAFRVGKNVIVGFPNFAQIKARFRMFFLGRVPITPSLPFDWHDTPNLHFLSILDFTDYCRRSGITIVKSYFIGKKRPVRIFPNLFAHTAIFLIKKIK